MIVGTVVVAALSMAACSGNDDTDDSTPVITDPVETTDSTTSTSSTTSTTIDPDAAVKAEVEEAYVAYWDAFLEIFAHPNPNNPLIEMHTTEAVRDATLSGITQFVLDGHSLRAPVQSDHFSVSVLGIEVNRSRAEVSACFVDGAQVIENATGTVLNDALATKQLHAEVVEEDGLWKVAQSRIVERREGIWDCQS